MIRFLLKYYIRWRIRQYLAFFEKHNGQQSNMNIAKARLMKARLMYWQDSFEPWGTYFIKGRFRFSYNEKTKVEFEKEMVWMGFTRDIRNKEWSIVKNEAYPWIINYYPSKTTGFHQNVAYPLDYREIINKETKTFENYEIPKQWRDSKN